MTEEDGQSGSLITLGIVKLDVGPLRKIWDKYGGAVLRRAGPIFDKELHLFQQKQMICELDNLAKFEEKVQQIRARRQITNDEVSPNVADQIIDAAIDEEREELRDIWAKLLVAAMDPQRKGLVRRSVIAAVKLMDPLDALVLESMYKDPPPVGQHLRNVISDRLGASGEEIDVSIANLTTIGLITSSSPTTHYVTPLGKILMGAVAD